jgi:hypothetical protein
VRVTPTTVEAGRRNTFSRASGKHRLVLGLSRQSWFSTTGPPEGTWANLKVVKFTIDRKLVGQLSALPSPVQSDACYHSNSDGDTFTLTTAGLKMLQVKPKKVVLYSRKVCSGASSRASRSLAALSDGVSSGRPNCRRSCGGNGECDPGCKFREPDVGVRGGPKTRLRPPTGHDCSLVVTETATLEDVFNGAIYAVVTGSHVPAGEPWLPNHPYQLETDRVVLGAAAAEAARAGQAGRVSATLAAKQGEQKAAPLMRARRSSTGASGSPPVVAVPERPDLGSSVRWHAEYLAVDEAHADSGSMLRVVGGVGGGGGGGTSAPSVAHPALAPSGRKIAAAARKRVNSTTGDESETRHDWGKIETFAREVILPKGGLVLFRRPRHGQPGMLVVSSQTGAQLLAAISGGFVCADAKVDTNAAKSPLSAIAARTDRGTVYIAAWWIAQKENQAITTEVGRALLGYVPCCKPECGCTTITTFGARQQLASAWAE